MSEFSGLYKEMCEKAERLQKDWILQQSDYYCKRGDRKDGFEEFLSEKEISGMSNEAMENFKSNRIWLPRGYQVINRLLPTGIQGQNNLMMNCYKEFREDKDKMKDIGDRLKDKVGDINDVKALIFYMEYECGMTWDYDKKEWVEIKK